MNTYSYIYGLLLVLVQLGGYNNNTIDCVA